MKKIHGGLSRISCPSLAELNALLVVAELKSFTKAAQALNLTQSAVSRQISSLEEFLGVSLFVRANGRLLLTEQAVHYISKIESPLEQLERASNDLKLLKTVGGELRLSTLPTFAAKWLIPKLPTFFQTAPEVTLSFVSHTKAYVTDDPDAPDAAIRFGSGNWPNEESLYLEGKEVCAIMSTAKKPIHSQDGLNKATLLHHTSVLTAWPEWLTIKKMKHTNAKSGTQFDQFSLLVQAASLGLGIALVPRCLVQDDINAGRVQEIFSHARVNLSNGYYLCNPESKSDLPAINTFKKWLNEQLASSKL
jgi:LysR family transcriptional regulator, glycine cleavage system transcriptional activator